MHVRDLRPGEEGVLWDLYHDTIHRVNIRDYSASQVTAWAPDDLDPNAWEKKMQSIQPFVVECDNQIIGYSDLQPSGLIDQFFVHHQWQRRGVGRLLMAEIQQRAADRCLRQLETHASLTARPFFEAFAFVVVRQQEVEVRGVKLNNYLMRRSLIGERVV